MDDGWGEYIKSSAYSCPPRVSVLAQKTAGKGYRQPIKIPNDEILMITNRKSITKVAIMAL